MADYGYVQGGTMSDGKYASIGEAPAEPGPFGIAAMAFDEARGLSMRISQLADRLCGPVPTPVSSQGTNAGSPAILPALRIGSEQTRDMIREAHSALERIERSLS
jgi:hypothetical protein